MTTPLALTDRQLDRVIAAASMLPVTSRNAFLKSVAGRVAGLPNVGTPEIESAIHFVLNSYGVIGGPAFNGKHDKAARARQQAERRFSRVK